MLNLKTKFFTRNYLPLAFFVRYKKPKDRLKGKLDLKPNIPILDENSIYNEEEKISMWKKAKCDLEPPYLNLSKEERYYLREGYLDDICINNVTLKKHNKADVNPNEAPFNEVYQDGIDEGNFTKASNLLLKEPERWFWVERLFPKNLYKEKFKDSEIFVPKLNDYPDLPYFISRTRNNLLPIYKKVDYEDQRAKTLIRKIDGDIWALQEQIQNYLEKLYKKRIISSVNENNGQIQFMGNYVIDVYNYLIKLGF